MGHPFTAVDGGAHGSTTAATHRGPLATVLAPLARLSRTTTRGGGPIDDQLEPREGPTWVSDDDAPDGSLARRLDHLFRTVRPDNGPREYTLKEVEAGLAAGGTASISATYVWQLRKGLRTDPRMSHLIALAEFFRVSPAYFFADDLGAEMAADLEVVAALRSPGVRELALAAQTLPPPAIAALHELVRSLGGDPTAALQQVPAGD